MTDPLPWRDVFSVGHPELDTEHRRMLGLVNQTCAACDANQREDVVLFLRELENVTVKHFEHEEAVLDRLYAGTPKDRRTLSEMLVGAKREHAVEHRQKLGDLQDFMKRASRADEVAGSKFSEELKAWFISHAIGYDAQIKTIIQSA